VDLSGKVALVTDVGSETGAAIAARFTAAGAQVAACKAAGVRAGTSATAPPGVLILDGDLCVPADARRMVQTIAERFGRLDVLVNHGAGGRLVGTVADVTQEELHEAMAGDVWSVMTLCAATIPLMRQGGGGSIINIASIGWQGLKGRPLRASSQAAAVTLTRSMALDHAEDRIRVNAILLGPTHTSTMPAAQAAEQARRSPLGELGKPEDVAAAALFLASDDARLITGVLLAVDAGRSIPAW
jgi:NAD(P)-dependent dehydrogenase (short-subunit alcohol dehydrogenase family)